MYPNEVENALRSMKCNISTRSKRMSLILSGIHLILSTFAGIKSFSNLVKCAKDELEVFHNVSFRSLLHIPGMGSGSAGRALTWRCSTAARRAGPAAGPAAGPPAGQVRARRSAAGAAGGGSSIPEAPGHTGRTHRQPTANLLPPHAASNRIIRPASR